MGHGLYLFRSQNDFALFAVCGNVVTRRDDVTQRRPRLCLSQSRICPSSALEWDRAHGTSERKETPSLLLAALLARLYFVLRCHLRTPVHSTVVFSGRTDNSPFRLLPRCRRRHLTVLTTKAVAGAKSLGNFLYSAVNKAGAKVSEAGAKIKKTVEENCDRAINNSLLYGGFGAQVRK
ncbi:hypothetical protein EVAR_58847_1 [Eumeta japonica]|uniref:Uncharacterized protein n=1 Tax=Eumeta variegata TaxID=151549 RepID=A0A4C1Y697_EUMVA|nr:hypothetical protein EVAR_58847_1 [Eumeta japonica]